MFSCNITDVYNGEEFEGEDEQNAEYLCPFCTEDFDMVGLCCHIDEEHAVEAKNGVFIPTLFYLVCLFEYE